jgi:hypothetical protein
VDGYSLRRKTFILVIAGLDPAISNSLVSNGFRHFDQAFTRAARDARVEHGHDGVAHVRRATQGRKTCSVNALRDTMVKIPDSSALTRVEASVFTPSTLIWGHYTQFPSSWRDRLRHREAHELGREQRRDLNW